MKASTMGVIDSSCKKLGKRCIDKRLVEITLGLVTYLNLLDQIVGAVGRLFASVYGDFVVDFMVFTRA